MKKVLFVVAISLMAACSPSRYAANFQNYKANIELAGGSGEMKKRESVITPIQPGKLVASTNNETARVAEATPLTTVVAAEQIRKTYLQMNKTERKSLRNALRVELRKQMQLKKNNNAPARRGWWQGWDMDLKLAAIFGAIATVAFIIYMEPFWIIAVVAFVIGLVFFIKWFVRQ